MATELSPKQPLALTPEPCSPLSPEEGNYNPVLRLKAVVENGSHLSDRQKTQAASPSSSLLDSPQASPTTRFSSLSPQPLAANVYSATVSGHIGQPPLLSPNSIKSLKFSIENILKPEFGKNGKDLRASPPVGNSNNSKTKNARSFDISSLTGKRKHSSDSECSTTSSFSSASKEDSQKTDNSTPPKNKRDDSPPKLNDNLLWPAWVYCTRYSDRPSSGE
ncbi:engrailed-like protein [Dinothrombium tinctorium]|uniref:Engrailed-like protein n=1 Tax=Dinothrombium tinctorium TaxID=1965070 RepID=A0A3S4QZ96_9ACAR|nr:engrailed-like protein [Dinothrombium tinctorium]